jgi:hypothetical protein
VKFIEEFYPRIRYARSLGAFFRWERMMELGDQILARAAFGVGKNCEIDRRLTISRPGSRNGAIGALGKGLRCGRPVD